MQALYKQREKLLPLLNQEAEKVIGRDLEEVSKKSLAFQDSVRLELIHKMILAANPLEVIAVRIKVLDEAEAKLNEYQEKMPELVRRYTEIQEELAILNKNKPGDPDFLVADFTRFCNSLTLKELLVYSCQELYQRYMGYVNQTNLIKKPGAQGPRK